MGRSTILFVAIAVLLAGRLACAAEPVGVVTIVEGDAVAIRGLSKFALAEGVRVLGDDLVETGKSTFLRVEFVDGAIVDLGPATRAQLNRPSLRKLDRPTFYLLSGWLKVSAGKLGAGAKGSIAAPQLDANGLIGETVERVGDGDVALFAEDGPVRATDRRSGVAVPIQLRSGDFLTLRKGEAPRVESRPAREFVAALPRQFQDPLPSRIAQFRGGVSAKPIGTFTYAEVEPWLDAELMVRRRFTREWAAKATDEAFRERLDAGLTRHPEWERVLYPERFEPKPPPPVASAPPVAPAPAVAPAPVVPSAGGSAAVNPSVPAAAPATGPQAGEPGH